MPRVEIALAANGSYFYGMFVTACSIAKSARKDCRLSFNILDGGLAEDDYNFMVKKVRQCHADSIFNRLLVSDEMFAAYPAWHGNKMAYARLILPSTLPEKDWCIYCDVDFVWLRDIVELWEMRDEHIALIGTADGNGDTLAREESWFAKKGFPFDRETYFCSGLCFFNLKAFRAQKLITRCAEILEANPDIQFPDQAVLNIVTYGGCKIVSRDWQRFTYELTEKIVRLGCVIHYAGEIPWKPFVKHGMISGSFYLWHQMNARYRGISTWQSLRMFYSPWNILRHRMPYYFWRLPGMIGALKIVCRVLGKSPAVWQMKAARVRRLVVGDG